MTSRAASPVVLFDLDDTLMAHREAVATGIVLQMQERAYDGDRAAAQRLWHELEEHHYHAYLTGDLSFVEQRLARVTAFALAHGEELDEPAAGEWFAHYFERYRESWALYDDALEALDAVATALPGVRFGVITNGELDQQTMKLERLGLLPRMAHVIASGEVGVVKPGVEIFRAARDRFASDAAVSACAYVGDRVRTDAIGAATAGLLGVWLNRRGESLGADDAADAAASGVVEIRSLRELAGALTARFA